MTKRKKNQINPFDPKFVFTIYSSCIILSIIDVEFHVENIDSWQKQRKLFLCLYHEVDNLFDFCINSTYIHFPQVDENFDF